MSEGVQEETIALLPPNGFHKNEKQSEIGLKWLKHIETQNNIILQKYGNSGEFKIEGLRVDGYHQPTNTVYEFLGDYWHGCPVHFKPDTVNQSNGKTMGELYLESRKRKSLIEGKGYNYVEEWECCFKNKLN